MPILRKVLIVTEWCVLGFLALYVALSFYEIFHAWNAATCGIPGSGTGSCYPWGGEGPVAGSGWGYASRENYLATVIAFTAVFGPVVAVAVWLRTGYRLLTVIAAFLVLKIADPLVHALAEVLR